MAGQQFRARESETQIELRSRNGDSFAPLPARPIVVSNVASETPGSTAPPIAPPQGKAGATSSTMGKGNGTEVSTVDLKLDLPASSIPRNQKISIESSGSKMVIK